MLYFKNEKNCDLKNRILKTLKIVEDREYNLSIEKLSNNLIGGEIDIDTIMVRPKLAFALAGAIIGFWTILGVAIELFAMVCRLFEWLINRKTDKN